MATDLEERNAEIYDDDKPSWKTSLDKTSETGDEGSSSDALTSKDIQAKEKSGAKSSSTAADASEGGSLFKAGKPKKFSLRSKISNKKAAVGLGIASTILTGIIVVFLQIPNLLVNQLKEMLIGRIGNVQMYQQRRYRQGKVSRMSNFFSKDGRMGEKMLAEMRTDGYEAIFSKDGKSIIGLKPSRNANGIIGTGIGDNLEEWIDRRHPFRSSRWKTKRMNAFKKIYGVVSTSVVDAEKAKSGPDKDLPPDNQVNKNVATDVIDPNADGEIDELKVQGDPAEKTPEEQKVIDDKLADDTNNPLTEELKAEQKAILTEGAEVNPKGLASELGSDIITPNLADSLEKGVVNASVGSKFIDGAKGVLNPLDIVDRVCTIRSRAQGAIQLARAARSVKLIRYAMVFINAADDTRRGNANPKLMNSLMKRVTSEDANGNSIGGSPGFAYMMKGKYSKSRNSKSKQSVAVDGKLTGVVGGINDRIGTLPGIKTGCPFAQNPLVQVGAGAGSLVIGFFSGGSSEAALIAAEQTTTQVIRVAVTGIVKSILTKQVAGKIALGFISEISFQGFMGYMSAYVQKQLLLPFTGQEKGGQLGDILVAGAGASNKQRSLNAGMVPATSEQYASAESEYVAWRDTQFKNLSFKERIFNSEHPNNLMLNLALASPTSATDFANSTKDASVSLASSVLNPGKYIGLLGNILGGKVSAETEDYVAFETYTLNGTNGDRTELATDPAGNLQVIMRSDIEAIEPEPNADTLIADNMVDAQTLQPIAGSNFASHVENCVNNPDLITQLEEGDTFDCLAKKEETKRFKAHLAYLDTRDAFDAEFFPEEIDEQEPTGQTANPSGGNNKIYTIGDSLTVGMRDSGDLGKKYSAAAWDSTKIEATSGDRIEQAIPKLIADKVEVGASGSVVVMLGTNKSNDFATKIKSMIDTIRTLNPNAAIYWMNAATDKADYSDINSAIQSQSAGLKYKVIDWNAEYNKNKAKYPLPDGIHMNAAGYKLKSDFLISQLGPPPAPQAAVAGVGGIVDLAQTSPIPGAGGNIRIATSILPAVTAMLDAARAQGVELLPISSGWRDPQVQIALRKQNCPDWQNSNANECSPPTAKPGRSNHEKGEAIDFGNMCFSPRGSTSCPGNRRWEWLKANAAKYGFKPLASEAWHWSTTGN